jgi:oleandomycin transport system ATP-binding protein
VLRVPVDGDGPLTETVTRLAAAGIALTKLSLRPPDLDEVFFALTGRPVAEEKDTEEKAA